MNHKNRHTKFINNGRDPVTKNAAVKKEKGQAGDSLKATTKMTSTGKPTFGKTIGHDNKPTPPEPLANARYYTKDGLRIPLYDSRVKRITHARDGRVILHKSNKKAVIDGVVASYAGEATAKTMENWTKNQIGDWITEVETKAYGNPPRAKTMKEKKEEKAARKQAASSARSPVENAGQRSRTSPDTAMETEEPQGRVARSMSDDMKAMSEDMKAMSEDMKAMSEEMKAMLEIDWEASHLDFSTPTSPTLQAPVSKAKSLVDRVPEANIPLKDEAFSIVTSVNSDVHKKRKMTSPPAEPQQTPKKQKTDPPQLSSCTSPTMSQGPTRRDWYTWNPAHADLLAPRSTIHPSSTLISAFSLTPSWDANPSIFMSQAPPLRVLPLPGPQAHLLLLATTSAPVHPLPPTPRPHFPAEGRRAI